MCFSQYSPEHRITKPLGSVTSISLCIRFAGSRLGRETICEVDVRSSFLVQLYRERAVCQNIGIRLFLGQTQACPSTLVLSIFKRCPGPCGPTCAAIIRHITGLSRGDSIPVEPEDWRSLIRLIGWPARDTVVKGLGKNPEAVGRGCA
jgi:hypothetical protein